MSDLIAEHAELAEGDLEWLHLLVGDWQIVSDLAFADLVLWLPTADGRFVAVAQCRPSTGATVHYDDVVGSFAPEGQRPQLAAAMSEGRAQRSREPRWFGAYAVREEAVPVVHDGRAIAVVARQTNLGSGRTPSRLELNYIESADDLLAMIGRGEYPSPNAATGPRRGAPRVGDGLIRLNSEGEVLYASPNALSCFHRLGVIGPLVGQSLVEVTAGIAEQQSTVDESLPLVVMGRAPWRTDIEAGRAALSLRALPLTDRGQRIGAVLLCRDVSELRRRERELMTKDATIREIHHRVKNNLATVAALLRLQARRMEVPEARAALEEAMRRVATISLVHESLSQTLDESVELDDMLKRALRLAADVASTRAQISTRQSGSFGLVPAQDATPLALVLTELVTNAVEHGFPGQESGTVSIDVEREDSSLRVVVADDGVGMRDGIDELGRASRSGLGSQIVKTLVVNELRGTIDWLPREGGGTQVVLQVHLRGDAQR
ncbi:two-component sensor histidine kinase [Isoptericola sp. CG 20/1183]|uniref:histidine kinase n=1 Tax=Isoptericola halotolerans TaxID=300560 RepID=A0ABX5EDT4_9MICO|nr:MULTISPECIES: PAS domain-containing sensor histidine kinase [Isoptericola]PRZ06507.1 two-component sensor histidine kinase [Isoptericola halotolerans]PRZ06687.1 two-component sensor histidine kinase [Isoptericola sp. CG 20/1183]